MFFAEPGIGRKSLILSLTDQADRSTVAGGGLKVDLGLGLTGYRLAIFVHCLNQIGLYLRPGAIVVGLNEIVKPATGADPQDTDLDGDIVLNFLETGGFRFWSWFSRQNSRREQRDDG
jgi:hypothetical protein